MKVLYITNNDPTKQFPVFGIFVKEQIDSLAELGINNEIFFINGREKGKFEYIRSIFRLRSFLKDKKYDLIHCHHALSALCLIMSGRMRNFKTIMSYQSNPVNEQGNYIYKFVKNSFDAVIIKNHSQVIDNKVVFCQPNGVNIDFFQPIDKEVCIKKLKLNKNKIYVLFVSSNHIRQEKRYDKFQATIEILKTKYNLHNIEELKLINIKRSLVPYYFNAASAHLLTSDFEGSPNSVKEAMACNLPVVSTNVGSVKELLQNVNGSYVAKTNEPEELADLIYKVLNETRKNNGREQLIKQELDIVSVAKKIKAIYKKVLN